MKMMLGEGYVPIRKVGYLYPQPILDYGPYEFYHMAPDRMLIVGIPIGLTEFSAEEVDRVYAPIEKLCDLLVERHVQIIVQGGGPLAAILRREGLRRLLDHIERYTKLPATSGLLCCMEAARKLGIKKIAVINKWNQAMNDNLAEFFSEIGVEVVGVTNKSMQPTQFNKFTTEESTNISYELGRTALQACPDADGLFIGGGAWLTLPAVLQLEKDFGKPVIAQQPATAWHVCKMLDCWQPKKDMGVVLALP
jgi:maleate cis-trans isomerase